MCLVVKVNSDAVKNNVAFQTLGVMNEAADEIATGAQVLTHDTNYFIF